MKDNQENRHRHILAAREMRMNSTTAEVVLWAALRNRRLSGLRFYRQRVIGPLIADFYCAAAKLIIEVDGDVHDNQKEYDSERTRVLEDRCYQVIRFSNEMVLNDLERVLSQINSISLDRISDLTPNPSPETRRGESEPAPDSIEKNSPLPLISREGAGG